MTFKRISGHKIYPQDSKFSQ